MNKYFKNTKDMSLDKKISWVINKVPHILLNDIFNVLNNNGDTICILESVYCGNYAAKKAIESAINFLNTDIALLKSTYGILVILTLPPNYIFGGIDPLDVIYTHVPYESPIIHGISTNHTFSENYAKATIVFVGSKPRGM